MICMGCVICVGPVCDLALTYCSIQGLMTTWSLTTCITCTILDMSNLLDALAPTSTWHYCNCTNVKSGPSYILREH